MQPAPYTRLYTDDDGESHFEDLVIDLSPTDYAPPAAPLNLATFLPASQSFWIGLPTDWAGDTPHPTPRRQILCTVQGNYQVTASDGTARSFPAGSVLLVEDTWGKGHATHVVGEEEVLIFGVALADS